MKRIWENILRDLWVMLLDIIAVNLAYYLALLVRFYVNHEMYTVAADFCRHSCGSRRSTQYWR